MTGSTATARRWLLPTESMPDAAVLLRARAVRGFGDGLVSILLPLHLATLGLDSLRIGAIVTATLIGSAALTLLVGLAAHRFPQRSVLLRASTLMVATGLGFALLRDFWPLLVVAFLGTLNPSSGDVSVFLPTEQSFLATAGGADQRTALFARYNLVGSLAAAVGALSAGLPDVTTARLGLELDTAVRAMFALYALLGLVALYLYRGLSPAVESATGVSGRPLGASKTIVYRLAALFSLDSFAGGFVVQSLLALWLFERFGLSVTAAGTVFFWTGLLSAGSQLAAPRLARRIGLIRSMVFTHLPANACLILAAFMPTAPLSVALLLARSALSQMDIPARQSFVMAVVEPGERPAAASITNVPRSLAAAAGPLPAGWLLGASTFGWPLVIAGTLKATYDLLLLALFRTTDTKEQAHMKAPRPAERGSSP